MRVIGLAAWLFTMIAGAAVAQDATVQSGGGGNPTSTSGIVSAGGSSTVTGTLSAAQARQFRHLRGGRETEGDDQHGWQHGGRIDQRHDERRRLDQQIASRAIIFVQRSILSNPYC